MSPVSTIHTDLCATHGFPHTAFIYNGSGDGCQIKRDLKLGSQPMTGVTGDTLTLMDIMYLIETQSLTVVNRQAAAPTVLN